MCVQIGAIEPDRSSNGRGGAGAGPTGARKASSGEPGGQLAKGFLRSGPETQTERSVLWKGNGGRRRYNLVVPKEGWGRDRARPSIGKEVDLMAR